MAFTVEIEIASQKQRKESSNPHVRTVIIDQYGLLICLFQCTNLDFSHPSSLKRSKETRKNSTKH